MNVSIYRSSPHDAHVLHGNIVRFNHRLGDTFTRFYIFDNGRIEIHDRTEYDDAGTFDESDVLEVLYTSLYVPSIEHTISRFYGNTMHFWYGPAATRYLVKAGKVF